MEPSQDSYQASNPSLSYDIHQQFESFWLSNFDALRYVADIPDTDLGKEFSQRKDQISFLTSPSIKLDPSQIRTLPMILVAKLLSIAQLTLKKALGQSGQSLGSSLNSSQASAPIQLELRVKRGLGILEEMINEKNPRFFKNIQEQSNPPQGMPIAELERRLGVQIRRHDSMQSTTQVAIPVPSNISQEQNMLIDQNLTQESRVAQRIQQAEPIPALFDDQISRIDDLDNTRFGLESVKGIIKDFIFPESSDHPMSVPAAQKPLIPERSAFEEVLEKNDQYFAPQQNVIPQQLAIQQQPKAAQTPTKGKALPDVPTFAHTFPSISKKEEQKAEPFNASEISSLQLVEESGIIDETYIMYPYTYQIKIVQKILKQWGLPDSTGQDDTIDESLQNFKELDISDRVSQQNNYGSIIFIETGAGKSYISLMLIKSLFGERHDKLAELTPQQLKEKRENREGQLNYSESEASARKKVVFIVPTNNLVEQQSSVIERYTESVRVGKFQGGKNNKRVYMYENWIQQFRDNDVFVFIARKFYDLLLHGYIKMDQIDLLILDEAHHTNQEHLYNLVMTDFFYADYQLGVSKRPKILALTASPIKQKIDNEKIYKHDIEKFLQSLADNLYSKFVSVSSTDLEEMRNECTIEVMTYKSLFEQNAHIVHDIELNLILKLLNLLPRESIFLPANLYKIGINPEQFKPNNISQNQIDKVMQQLLQGVNSTVFSDFKQQQDAQMLKFISTRKRFIDLEVSESKRIDLSLFRNGEDRTLILLIIMILKNINNLIVELGMLGLQMFLYDLRRDLIEKQSDKFKGKSKKILDIFNQFIDERVMNGMDNMNRFSRQLAEMRIEDQMKRHAQMNLDPTRRTLATSDVSDKVYELVNILEVEYQKNPKLKAIIFVKDRSVATYLKKILDMMFKNMARKRMNQQNESIVLETTLMQELHKQGRDQSLFENAGEPELDYGLQLDFKCNFAIGFQGKSLTNKAYRSTKSIEDEIQQLSEFLPQFSHVKMTHQNLMKNIEDFKNDRINVLIATSVIEEGLDVSSCNLVISINEVLNVKSFIQTKGRARQKNSKFIFLCSNEEKEQVEQTIEGFKKLITNIQDIAYNTSEKAILPDQNIIFQKQRHPWQQIVSKPPFCAKVTMREAPSIFELLANDLIESLNNNTIKEEDLKPTGLILTKEQTEFMELTDKQRHKRRVVQKTEESLYDYQYPKFKTKLIMPEYLKYFFYESGGVVYDAHRSFSKKKESENYAYIMVVQKLYSYGLYAEDFYPDLDKVIWKNVIQNIPAQVSIPYLGKKPNPNTVEFIPSRKYVPPPPQPSMKAQVSEQLMKEKRELQNQKEQYTKEAKRSSLPVPVHSVYIDKPLKIQTNPPKEKPSKNLNPENPTNCVVDREEQIQAGLVQQQQSSSSVYILVFKGASSIYDDEIQTQSSFSLRRHLHSEDAPVDDSYPYKKLTETLGILWDKNMSNDHYKLFLELQQENRQKQKNSYYLERLHELGMISDAQKLSMLQLGDILELRLETIQFDLGEGDMISKLKLFHYWFFYFVNNANHRFYKKVLSRTFSFSGIFNTVIMFLNKVARKQRQNFNEDFLDHIFKIKPSRLQPAPSQLQEEESTMCSYMVPIKGALREGTMKFSVNLNLIEEIIDYIKIDLISFCLADNTHKSVVTEKYDLAETFSDIKSKNIAQSIRNVWTCDSNQSIFVVMTANGSREKLYSPANQFINSSNKKGADQSQKQGNNAIVGSLLTLDIEDDMFWNYKHISLFNGAVNQSSSYLNNSRNSMNSSMRSSSKNATVLNSELQTISEHYFSKTGVYLTRDENKFLYKCSKERSLLDFSVQKSTLINNATDHKAQHAQSVNHSIGPSTLFDLPQQLMKLVPLRYEQYQMLLLSNFFYASLLEILKVEKFINAFLTDLSIHLEDPEGQLNLQQWYLTPRLYQMRQESVEKEKSSLEESKEGDGDVVMKDKAEQMPLSNFIKQDFMLMVEAMTAPTANKPIDYERLEFYGDSVISFLVILELFLTTATRERSYKEGELDFYRIKAVSNMNLALINEKQKIYEYIITDSTKVIAEELQPPGFSQNEYHTKIKAKQTNEMKSKLLYLKKCEIALKDRIFRQKVSDMTVTLEYVELVKMFLQSNTATGELWTPLDNLSQAQAYLLYEEERDRYVIEHQRSTLTSAQAKERYHRAMQSLQTGISPKDIVLDMNTAPRVESSQNTDLIWRVAERWLYELELSLDKLRLAVVQFNIDKMEAKYHKEKNKKHNMQQQQLQYQSAKNRAKKKGQLDNSNSGGSVVSKMRHFQPKQLADTVESITGAIANSAGLFSAQEYLKKMEVLKFDTARYEKELESFIDQNQLGLGYQNLMHKYGYGFEELQEIIGYKFQHPCLLIQAMTHKSFKEHFNTQKEHAINPDYFHIDDYERLEFLGDSILNFLIAQYYFTNTRDKPSDYQPKQLHKLKTSVVNNVFLSLVVVQRGIHNYVLYNQNSEQFKKQYEHYVSVVEDVLSAGMMQVPVVEGEDASMIDSSAKKSKARSEEYQEQEFSNLNMEPLYEHTLKIFGDIFESIIGAVFLDCRSISKTEIILHSFLKPFLKNHSSVETLDDHSRTKLLELWNSKGYTRNYKIRHEVDQRPDGSSTFRGWVGKVEVRKVRFEKDMKNKVRRFYNDFLEFVEAYVKVYESRYGMQDSSGMERELKEFRKAFKPQNQGSGSDHPIVHQYLY